MKILFIVGREKEEEATMPIGIGYMAGILKSCGHNIRSLILPHIDPEACSETIKKMLHVYKPDRVLVSGYTSHWTYIKLATSLVKKHKAELPVIAGGPLFIAQPRLSLQNMPEVDVVCLGEGEPIINSLVEAGRDAQKLAAIPGLMYRDPQTGDIVHTGKPLLVEDVDALSFPDFDAMDYEVFLQKNNAGYTKYAFHHFLYRRYPVNPGRSGVILGARGCPFNCTFCDHVVGRKYRQRSLDNIFLEIDFQLKKYSLNHINFMDDLFSFNKKRVLEFCSRIKKYNLRWSAQMRVDSIDEEVVSAMAESNVLYLSLGIESADNSILKSFKKKITISQINNALELFRKYKCFAYGNIIFGDIEETFISASNSVRWLVEHPEYNINFQQILYVPNSKLYQEAVSRGFISDPVSHNQGNFKCKNLTKMNDTQYNIILTLMSYITCGYHLPGSVIKNVDTKSRIINVICPHCQKNIPLSMNNINLNLPVLPFTCPQCYGQGKIISHRLLSELSVPPEKVLKFKQAYINELNSFKNLYDIIDF